MKELFLYSIFGIVLYFVLSIVFDNFNLEQENFDPSLIPVSSIITLAKVAQKLVNGNGILTNPANLQIGLSATASGNLIVTGNSSVNGNLSITGSANFPMPITLNTGNSNISSNLATNKSITAGSSSNPQSIKTWGSVISNSLTIGPDTIQFNGPVKAGAGFQVTGNENLTDNLNACIDNNNNTRIGSIWTTAGVYAESGTTGLELGADNNNVYIGSAAGNYPNNLNVTGMLNAPGNIKITNSNPYILFSKSGQNSNPQIYSSGNTIHIHGGNFQADKNATIGINARVDGKLNTSKFCIGSTCIDESSLINFIRRKSTPPPTTPPPPPPPTPQYDIRKMMLAQIMSRQLYGTPDNWLMFYA
jgi:hypothetical protein